MSGIRYFLIMWYCTSNSSNNERPIPSFRIGNNVTKNVGHRGGGMSMCIACGSERVKLFSIQRPEKRPWHASRHWFQLNGSVSLKYWMFALRSLHPFLTSKSQTISSILLQEWKCFQIVSSDWRKLSCDVCWTRRKSSSHAGRTFHRQTAVFQCIQHTSSLESLSTLLKEKAKIWKELQRTDLKMLSQKKKTAEPNRKLISL